MQQQFYPVRVIAYVLLVSGFLFGLCDRTIAAFTAGWTPESIVTLLCASFFGLAAAVNPPPIK